MTDKILNQGRPGVDITQARNRAVNPARESARSSDSKQTDAPRDNVELTNTATNLQRIEAKLASVPEADQSRIDDVRQRLDAGTYEVDYDRLAEKMLRLEQDLS